MEELNKHQLILLALLISFVTSIATGIVTVSLMDQAPKPVTQTINRVFEKTIEKVIPMTTEKQPVKDPVVVVREGDQIADAAEKISKSVIRIREVSEGEGATRFYSVGAVVSADGTILAVNRPSLNFEGAKYVGTLSSGKQFPLEWLRTDKDGGAVFRAVPAKDQKLDLVPATLSDSAALKLGQTVIAFGGESRDSISVGIVSGVVAEKVKTAAPPAVETGNGTNEAEGNATTTQASVEETIVYAIETDAGSGLSAYGSLLVNVSGSIVGVRIYSPALQKMVFSPINNIKGVLSAPPKTAENKAPAPAL